MVKPIFLCSLQEHVGKSFLSIGIMQKLQNEGKNVAYFKPIGVPRGAFSDKADPDVGFMLNTLFTTEKPYATVCPVSIPGNYYIDLIDVAKKVEFLNRIKAAYEEISKDMDYIVVEGASNIRNHIRSGLDDLSIASALGINDLIFIETESSDKCIDDIFFTKKYFDFREVKFKGVIFNKIDYEYVARIEELNEGHIKRYGIELLGIVEKSIELLSPRVFEVQEAIGGEFINAGAWSGLQNLVETFLIGAMNPQSALKYFRQVKNSAIITGGDRTDLALAALSTNVSCLILTGGFTQPDTTIITAANEKNVPIILSPSDTYTTIRNIENIKAGIQAEEINLVIDFIDKFISWNLLLS